jgi:hypothetical protein
VVCVGAQSTGRLLGLGQEHAGRCPVVGTACRHGAGQAFLVKPHGWRGYTFWATSPDFELMVGKSDKFPPVYVQMHSAYLHSMGVEPALHLAELFLRHELLAVPADLVVSRLDIHCDYQGWDPEIEDIRLPGPRPARPRRA